MLFYDPVYCLRVVEPPSCEYIAKRTQRQFILWMIHIFTLGNVVL